MDNEQYLNEVREALDKEGQKLGDVWREFTNENTNKNKPDADIAKDIAKKLGDPTHPYVYEHLRVIKAITKGILPKHPGTASQCGDNLRKFLSRHQDAFSEETIQTLEERAKECYRLAANLRLRRAYDSVERELGLDRFEKIKVFIRNRIDASRDQFFTEDYQQLLWKDNLICKTNRAPNINVHEVIQDRDFLNWFYDHYNEIQKLESQDRTKPLCKFANELCNKMREYSNKRPIFCIYRALATLFPENFTSCASDHQLRNLAELIDINAKGHLVEVHHRILNRLTEVLGEPDDRDEVIRRMILTWNLPGAMSQEEPEEKSNPSSDEGQGVDDSMTPVVPQLKDVLPQVNGAGYFPDDLCQKLHLGLWADELRHFAVLTGLSGAGKTLLARAYAEAITGEDPTGENPERSCIVAVQPGWTDPSYLLGYENLLQENKFKSTPFLELIIHADKHPESPHVALLDEMNLSHPEQYMAPLLSAMETGGSIEIHGRGETFDDVPSRIPYPNNLVLIGTVNMDETTHGLADKLLDRAFTLEFWEVNVDKWLDKNKNELPPEEKKHVKEILNALMEALEPARLHFGYRVIKEIIAFLERRLKDSPNWQFEKALDSVIYAKVLPKLRGDASKRISDALEECKKVLEDKERGLILSNSANKVEELIKDLEATGSARFWR